MVIALAQTPGEAAHDIEAFGERLGWLTRRNPGVELWVFPELHLEPPHAHADPQAAARALDPDYLAQLGRLARDLGIWLVPGSIYERGDGDAVHNTALAFSPEGELVASYRKIFPWRPAEPTTPGDRFVVFDIPDRGRVGLSICFDMWFPEHTRHLAWLGADVVLNVVLTPTSDREQELAIVRGNAIMNQVWVASVNAAAPTGRGRSLVVDPDGVVRASSPDAAAEILTAVVDFDATRQVRRYGTAAASRPWAQFHEGDAPLELPLYAGRIDPATWHPSVE